MLEEIPVFEVAYQIALCLQDEIKDYEFVSLFKVIYDGEIKIDNDEVSNGKFFTIEEIRDIVKNNREKFTPWFLEEWEFLESII